ncbi:MAG TPA: hypothetical protein PLT93_04615 [Phycisphaerae bacterium]|nr:hypothetical protein [Phycisphaerae bacterium]
MKRTSNRSLSVLGAILVLAIAGNALAYEYIIESRSGGKNFDKYSDVNCDNSSVKSSAAGCTSGIGCRYSTNVAAQATYTFTPNQSGMWSVHVTWPRSTNGDTAVLHTVTYAGGTYAVNLNQHQDAGGANVWNHISEGLRDGKKSLDTTFSLTGRCPPAKFEIMQLLVWRGGRSSHTFWTNDQL